MTGFPFLYFLCLIFTVFWDGTWATWTGTLWYGRSSCGRWRIWSRLHSDSAVSVRIQGLRISERRGGWHRKLDGLSILGAFLGVPQNILRHVIFVAWFLWFNNIQHRSQSSKLWPEPGCESHECCQGEAKANRNAGRVHMATPSIDTAQDLLVQL